jgi:AhpD family alkylhydroperoxidase
MRTKMEELDEIKEHFNQYFDLAPKLGTKFLNHYWSTYEDGVLDAKTKRLVALCGGIIAGCKGCILGQADHAVAQGASAEEILEVCSVAMSLGGTLAGSQISMVVQWLKEKDLV